MSPRYRRAATATERRVGSSLFLAHGKDGTLYRFNETVAALWNLLAKPVTVVEAVEVFRNAYPDEPAKRIAENVKIMFDDLLEEGLIERVPPKR